MATFGFSQSHYEIVAFTVDSSNSTEGVLQAVVVLRGGRRRTSRPPARPSGRRSAADMLWASWSNGYDEVWCSRALGVVSVLGREFDLCADGRTLVVLADKSRPADAAVSMAITDVPIPQMITGGTASMVWHMLTARLFTGKPYRWPHEAWMENVTGIPAVHAFLSSAPSHTR